MGQHLSHSASPLGVLLQHLHDEVPDDGLLLGGVVMQFNHILYDFIESRHEVGVHLNSRH